MLLRGSQVVNSDAALAAVSDAQRLSGSHSRVSAGAVRDVPPRVRGAPGVRPEKHREGCALDESTPRAYSLGMLTVVETLLFQRQWPLYWTEEERGAFAAYIAERPAAGDVVPESGGIRKVRWSRAGSGKTGGVRVIYFTRTAEGEVVLLTLYAKAKTDNLTGPKLKEIRRALEE